MKLTLATGYVVLHALSMNTVSTMTLWRMTTWPKTATIAERARLCLVFLASSWMEILWFKRGNNHATLLVSSTVALLQQFFQTSGTAIFVVFGTKLLVGKKIFSTYFFSLGFGVPNSVHNFSKYSYIYYSSATCFILLLGFGTIERF